MTETTTESDSWLKRFEDITAKDVDANGAVVDKPVPLTLPQELAVKEFITKEVTQAKIEQLVWVLKEIPIEGREWLGKIKSSLEGLIVEYSGKGLKPTE